MSEWWLLLLLIVPGQATFRNLSRYSVSVERTFSRWFRRKVDGAGLNVTAIQAVAPADHELVFAFDPSDIPKSGEHTEGLSHFWNGRAGRAERGLEVNTLGWVDVTANTAYTISAEMTPPKPSAVALLDTPANAEYLTKGHPIASRPNPRPNPRPIKQKTTIRASMPIWPI